jgi:hypothetical protein
MEFRNLETSGANHQSDRTEAVLAHFFHLSELRKPVQPFYKWKYQACKQDGPEKA